MHANTCTHAHVHTHMHTRTCAHAHTTEEEDIEGLVRVQNDQLWPKHDPGRLVLVVVHLHSSVAGATIRHHTSLITTLKEKNPDIMCDEPTVGDKSMWCCKSSI